MLISERSRASEESSLPSEPTQAPWAALKLNGQTDTPDFHIASGHRVPLHTDFHAIVDGTDGDTYLDPVKATVLHYSFTANVKVVRIKNAHGQDIELEVVLGHANIGEDLLKLGVKTDPPIMTGAVSCYEGPSFVSCLDRPTSPIG